MTQNQMSVKAARLIVNSQTELTHIFGEALEHPQFREALKVLNENKVYGDVAEKDFEFEFVQDFVHGNWVRHMGSAFRIGRANGKSWLESAPTLSSTHEPDWSSEYEFGEPEFENIDVELTADCLDALDYILTIPVLFDLSDVEQMNLRGYSRKYRTLNTKWIFQITHEYYELRRTHHIF